MKHSREIFGLLCAAVVFSAGCEGGMSASGPPAEFPKETPSRFAEAAKAKEQSKWAQSKAAAKKGGRPSGLPKTAPVPAPAEAPAETTAETPK
jgi:hypothetical protein